MTLKKLMSHYKLEEKLKLIGKLQTLSKVVTNNVAKVLTFDNFV